MIKTGSAIQDALYNSAPTRCTTLSKEDVQNLLDCFGNYNVPKLTTCKYKGRRQGKILLSLGYAEIILSKEQCEYMLKSDKREIYTYV